MNCLTRSRWLRLEKHLKQRLGHASTNAFFSLYLSNPSFPCLWNGSGLYHDSLNVHGRGHETICLSLSFCDQIVTEIVTACGLDLCLGLDDRDLSHVHDFCLADHDHRAYRDFCLAYRDYDLVLFHRDLRALSHVHSCGRIPYGVPSAAHPLCVCVPHPLSACPPPSFAS